MSHDVKQIVVEVSNPLMIDHSVIISSILFERILVELVRISDELCHADTEFDGTAECVEF